MLLKKNELFSLFFDDLCFNFWGLDFIIDEDLICLKIVLVGVIDGEVFMDLQLDILDILLNFEGGYIKCFFLVVIFDVDYVNIQVVKVEYLLQFQFYFQVFFVFVKLLDLVSFMLGGGMVKLIGFLKLVISRFNLVIDESFCDGEVDILIERIRVRNIMIDREKFLEF